jgi:hypothetical protein
MADVFDEYSHLSVFIETDAEENAERREMLRLGVAIRDSTVA